MKKESAVQSFGDLINTVKRPLEVVHSIWRTGLIPEKKFSVLHKEKTKVQLKLRGVTSWMIGSMAKPCMSQWNCSSDIDRRSSPDLGHVK